MARTPSESWEKFEAEYDFLRKFGAQAVREQLTKSKGDIENFDDVRKAMGYVIDSRLDLAVKNTSKADFEKLRVQLGQMQTPRGDDLLAPKAEANLQPGQQPRYEAHPITKKMDFASDNKVEEAARKVTANRDPNAAITDQFKQLVDKMENVARNEYKKRLTMKMTPSRKVEGPNL